MIPSKHIGIITKSGAVAAYQRMNLNSVTVADRDVINLGNSVLDGVRTVSFYFTPKNTIGSGVIGQQMFSRALYGVSLGRFDIWFLFGKINFTNWRGTSNTARVNSDSNSWTGGVEYHVSCVIHPVNGMEMYIDGVKQTETHAETGSIETHNLPTYIGGYHAESIRYFEGKIRNVQIWNTARTLSEITIDKDTYYPSGTTNLKETWHFANETGVTTTGENGNAGTISTLNAGGVTYINSTIREII